MSRHELKAKDPNHEIIVGWDPPLQTFFAQVIDRKKDLEDADDKFVLWIGCSPREIYEVDDLIKKVRRYAEIPSSLGSTLYGDKDDGI